MFLFIFKSNDVKCNDVKSYDVKNYNAKDYMSYPALGFSIALYISV